MPFVRGRLLPDLESAGPTRGAFDILLWGNEWSRRNAADLDEVEVLGEYLRSLRPGICEIRLLVPDSHHNTAELLRTLNIRFAQVPTSRAPENAASGIYPEELDAAARTAVGSDADVLVVTNTHWFPYIDEIDKLGLLLTDTGFLKRQCERFRSWLRRPVGVLVRNMGAHMDRVLPDD